MRRLRNTGFIRIFLGWYAVIVNWVCAGTVWLAWTGIHSNHFLSWFIVFNFLGWYAVIVNWVCAGTVWFAWTGIHSNRCAGTAILSGRIVNSVQLPQVEKFTVCTATTVQALSYS
jgi:hypothetical protein